MPANQFVCFHSVARASLLYARPVAATTMPVTVMARRPRNLKNMKKSALLVPSFVLVQFIAVTKNSPAIAMPLLIQGEASMLSAPIMALSMYSPKIIAMIAAEPGLRTVTAHHVKRNPAHSPNILLKYTCAPPLSGIAPPNSAYEAAPVHASNPAIAQTTNAAPRDPTLLLTAAGEEKIPDPMINPTTSESPLR